VLRETEMTRRATCEDATQRRPRIVLLAEDDDDLRTLLADALRAEGFDVVECPNGFSLVETLVTRFETGGLPFDLVVSDVRMPGISGLSVLEGLSVWEELRSLPTILITAFGTERLHELAQRYGAVSLLEKPFAIGSLMQVVREALADRPGGGERRRGDEEVRRR